MTDPADSMPVMRRMLAALLILGLIGTATELMLLRHYEDSWQFVPFFFIATSFGVLAWHGARPSVLTVRVLQATMAGCVVAALVGIALHYRGSLEFQLEVDPSLHGWPLFLKVVHAQAPPALGPGVMAQLGLLGLAFTYRHPALTPKAGASVDHHGSI